MNNTKSVLLMAGIAAGSISPALAQSDAAPIDPLARLTLPTPGTEALGDPLFGPIDVGAAAGGQRLLGVAFAWDHFWVSGGIAAAAGQQRIWKFTTAGALVGTFNQVTASPAPTFWGGRDGAADEANNKLYFGAENGELTEYTFNPATGNITHTATHSIPAAGVIRALAINPTNGNFYTGNFGGPIFEFTLTPAPAVVNTYANPGIAVYGLAYDNVNNTIWGWSQNAIAGSPDPAWHQVKATEMDATTLATTGRTFDGQMLPGCVTPGAACDIAGGADIFCDSQGRLVMVALHQAPTDSLMGYDLDAPCTNPCYPDCNQSGGLSIADFICFQGEYVAGNLAYADCNQSGGLSIADFICFQGEYVAGCP